LLRGAGRYTDDVILPGVLWMAIVRSPHAHARVRRIDGDPARRMPGVVAVLTRAELPECAGSVPPLVPAPDFHRYHHPVLAADRVTHVGEGVAVVVAESAYAAADAVEHVAVDYEPLPAAVSPEQAVVPGAPRVHEDWPDNLAGVSASRTGDAASGFARADLTVEMELYYPRVAGQPPQPRRRLAVLAPPPGPLPLGASPPGPVGLRGARPAAPRAGAGP